MSDLLNIALLCHPTVGGSGILATELGHRLADRGHEVYVISEKPPFRLKIDHPRVHFCESTPVEFPLFKSPDHTLPLATRIAEVCANHKIDVIHAHYAIPHTAAAWIANQLIGPAAPPVITTLHGTDIVYLGEMEEYRPLLEHVLQASGLVTSVSKNLKERTEKLFDLEGEIEVIPNFFEPTPTTLSREEVRSSLGIGEEVLAVHASNLRSIKRMDLMLDAFELAASHCDVKLLILAGADGSRIRPDIEKRGLENRVLIVDDVYEVDNYYSAADFTLYSSEYESFCLGILEGMRHGLPSVSFDVGGISEVVENGETGFLIPFGDVAKMGEAIVTMSDNSEKRNAFGDRAEARAIDRFSADTIVDLYLDAYRKVL